MRHQKTRHKLSRDAAHRKALLANLCVEVIDHERIKTTEAKAKAVKPELEKLITLAKRATCTRAGRRSRRCSTRQGRDLQAVRGDRPALRGASRRLHADPQARSASVGRDRDGLPRAR
jgi:ribosomal protein L17